MVWFSAILRVPSMLEDKHTPFQCYFHWERQCQPVVLSSRTHLNWNKKGQHKPFTRESKWIFRQSGFQRRFDTVPAVPAWGSQCTPSDGLYERWRLLIRFQLFILSTLFERIPVSIREGAVGDLFPEHIEPALDGVTGKITKIHSI